jgi:hypothetical protein
MRSAVVVVVAFVASTIVACSGASGSGASGNKDSSAGDDAGDDTLEGDGIFPVDDGSTHDSSSSDTTSVVDTGSAPDTIVPPSDTSSCGTPSLPCCGGACTIGYCNGGTCWANPTVVEEASDPGVCADLGVTHVSPAFFERFTIHGRPGATAYRYYIKTSCPGATAKVTPDSPFTLDATGTFTETIENTATADCTNANLGVYEVWIVVDGVESAHHVDSVFNSMCPTYATCGSVGSACPP